MRLEHESVDEIKKQIMFILVKSYLEERHGVVCHSPKRCFREAYKQELFAYDTFWMDMTDMRNRTAHLYSESMSDETYVARLSENTHCCMSGVIPAEAGIQKWRKFFLSRFLPPQE